MIQEDIPVSIIVLYFNSLLIFHYFPQTKHLQEQYENKREEEIRAEQQMETSRKEMKLVTSKRNTLLKSIEECKQNIRALGTLSEGDLIRYREMKTNQVGE